MTVVDDDTLAAVRECWRTDDTLNGLFDRLPETGRLHGGQKDLYAQIACEKGRGATLFTGGVRMDYRKVTITVRGPKDQVVPALQAVQQRFNSRLGLADQPTLVFPSGDRFHWWKPLSAGGTLKQEENSVKGTDVWAGIVEAEVASIRTDT